VKVPFAFPVFIIRDEETGTVDLFDHAGSPHVPLFFSEQAAKVNVPKSRGRVVEPVADHETLHSLLRACGKQDVHQVLLVSVDPVSGVESYHAIHSAFLLEHLDQSHSQNSPDQ
jgi:hypothetical protein